MFKALIRQLLPFTVLGLLALSSCVVHEHDRGYHNRGYREHGGYYRGHYD